MVRESWKGKEYLDKLLLVTIIIMTVDIDYFQASSGGQPCRLQLRKNTKVLFP